MSDWIQRIKEAKELLEIGAISASEFENIKNTLLQSNLRGQKPQAPDKSEPVVPPFELSFEVNSFKQGDMSINVINRTKDDWYRVVFQELIRE